MATLRQRTCPEHAWRAQQPPNRRPLGAGDEGLRGRGAQECLPPTGRSSSRQLDDPHVGSRGVVPRPEDDQPRLRRRRKCPTCRGAQAAVVNPAKPRVVVISCGGNDIERGATPEDIAGNFQRLVEAVRKDLPDTRASSSLA